MEKIIMVKHLALSPDVLDHICSFIFYTEMDVLIRNIRNYNIVLNEFKRVRREYLPLPHPNTCVYYILPIYNQLITTVLCSNCGNYTKPIHCSNIVCQCLV